jgi:hypothetical protein
MKMLIVLFVWIDHGILLFGHVIILWHVMNVHVYCITEKIHVQFVVNVSMMLFAFIRRVFVSFYFLFLKQIIISKYFFCCIMCVRLFPCDILPIEMSSINFIYH